jgi:AraC family transcriptional regulator
VNTSIKLSHSNKTLVLSSQNLSWQGILVEQYQSGLAPAEIEIPARSNHFLNLHLGQPVQLTQKFHNRTRESTVHQGESSFVPAGQASYWRCRGSDNHEQILHIHLQPELIAQIAETAELEINCIDLTHSFSKYDPHLQQIAMMLLMELKSDGILGQLYVESLTQVLAIYLLRNYSTLTPTIVTPENHSLTHLRLQQAIDYIHAYLDSAEPTLPERDLSVAKIAASVNISPSYFGSLFKKATGISLHQYVIKQRVERAKLLLTTTDLAIASIALQVGFSSQSHLTWHCKRLTGMTPKQIKTVRI